MIDQLRVLATSQPWFWGIRARLARVRFQIEAKIYQGRSDIANAKANARILAAIAGVAWGNFIQVAFVVGLLVLLERYLLENTRLLGPLSEEGKKYNTEQIRLFAQVLTGLFSIYFATVGIIVSAGYTRFRTDIIQLLTHEQVGSNYSKFIVNSAAFCLISASLPFLGIYPNQIIGGLSMTLTLASALALFPLGQRLFNFFNVLELLRHEIIPRISRDIARAADPTISRSLANHHSKAARIGLDQLAYLDDRILADKDGLASKLTALTDAYSSLLLNYLNRKHRIDHISYWFPRNRKHKQWFLSSDTETSMALQSSSQLGIEEKPDLNWFETLITKRLLGHIELAFQEKDYGLALSLIARFQNRSAVYANELQLALGMDELNEIKSLIEAELALNPTNKTSEVNLSWIAISDTWATMGSNLCLETLRRMLVFETEFNNFFAADVWTQNSLRTLPTFLQIELNFIIDRIDFEQKIEGQRLSRPKYVQQLAVQKLLQQYARILPTISDFFDGALQGYVEKLEERDQGRAATQVVLGSLHSYWKLPGWFQSISELLERYYAYAHYPEEPFSLPRIDMASIIDRINAVKGKSIDRLANAKLVGHIFVDGHSEEFPDHFGQIYFELVEAAIIPHPLKPDSWGIPVGRGL